MFSWKNSVNLCPVSFCTPRPNLPVIPGIYWLPTLYSIPCDEKDLFLVLVLEGLMKVKVKLLSLVPLFATPWSVVYQAPLSMGFSRQGYWSGLPFPSPGYLPNPGIKSRSPTLQADALPSIPWRRTNWDHSIVFEIAPKYCIWTLLLTMWGDLTD